METGYLSNKRVFICRLIVAVLFLWAGVIKIINPHDFADAVAGFRALPVALIHPTALVIPWFEILLSIGVLFPGVQIVRASSMGLIALDLVFILLLSSAWLRGLNVQCGCFGLNIFPASEWSIPIAIFRDMVLLLMLVWIYRDAYGRSHRSRS
jgi:putative oxidoreductase